MEIIEIVQKLLEAENFKPVLNIVLINKDFQRNKPYFNEKLKE